MTVEELKQYRAIKAEIKDLEISLKKNNIKDIVQGSDEEFPYTKHSIKVNGLSGNNENISQLNRLYSLRQRKKKIDDFIDDIENISLQRAFRLMYIEGERKKSWTEAAINMKYDPDALRMKCFRYIKNKKK